MTDRASHAPLRPGDPERVGPYAVHARLGSGGMGRVFLGRSPGGHTVALKVVHPDLADDPAFRRRFAAEVAAARRVGGFYTAHVLDADTEGDPPWLATAYIPGPTLHEAVHVHGPLPTASVASLGTGLAEGLGAVHAHDLVHRDLKPGNVLLAENGPRVIDFGIARALDAVSATRTRTIVGTAGFMAPEQMRGGDTGPACDVFALGCVLGYAATGRSPFGDGPMEAVGYRTVHEPPDLAGVPDALLATVRECLAKEPAERPALDLVLARLTPHAAPAAGGPGEAWLPETVTELIAERRTAILTAPPRTGDGTGAGDPEPAQPGTEAVFTPSRAAVVLARTGEGFLVGAGAGTISGGGLGALLSVSELISGDGALVEYGVLGVLGAALAVAAIFAAGLGTLLAVLWFFMYGLGRMPRLTLDTDGITVDTGSSPSPTRESVDWSDLAVVGVLGEGRGAGIAVLRRGEQPYSGSGNAGDGTPPTVLCRTRRLGVTGPADMARLRAALRHFAGDTGVELLDQAT